MPIRRCYAFCIDTIPCDVYSRDETLLCSATDRYRRGQLSPAPIMTTSPADTRPFQATWPVYTFIADVFRCDYSSRERFAQAQHGATSRLEGGTLRSQPRPRDMSIQVLSLPSLALVTHLNEPDLASPARRDKPQRSMPHRAGATSCTASVLSTSVLRDFSVRGSGRSRSLRLIKP